MSLVEHRAAKGSLRLSECLLNSLLCVSFHYHSNFDSRNRIIIMTLLVILIRYILTNSHMGFLIEV